MDKPKIIWHTFSNRAAFTEGLTTSIAETLHNLSSKQAAVLFGVSGGSTPLPVYQALADRDLHWPAINMVIVDERFVPTHHADSNERNIRLAFTSENNRSPNIIGLWSNVIDLHLAARTADEKITALQQPLDLVLLGMGEDGHFASLFPTATLFNEAIASEQARCILPIAPMPRHAPHSRLSMSLAYLRRAKRIILAITGEKKRQVLQLAIENGDYHALPIAALLHSDCPAIEIFWSE
jgi:6-phosphogluconolactonase